MSSLAEPSWSWATAQIHFSSGLSLAICKLRVFFSHSPTDTLALYTLFMVTKVIVTSILVLVPSKTHLAVRVSRSSLGKDIGMGGQVGRGWKGAQSHKDKLLPPWPYILLPSGVGALA